MTAALLVGLVLRVACAAFAVVVACKFPRHAFAWVWCFLWCFLTFRSASAWLTELIQPMARDLNTARSFVHLADALLIPGTASMVGIFGSFVLYALLGKLDELCDTIEMLRRKLAQEGHRL